jgi:uncharacterized protein Yka (UPF0111/DUF47 family)
MAITLGGKSTSELDSLGDVVIAKPNPREDALALLQRLRLLAVDDGHGTSELFAAESTLSNILQQSEPTRKELVTALGNACESAKKLLSDLAQTGEHFILGREYFALVGQLYDAVASAFHYWGERYSKTVAAMREVAHMMRLAAEETSDAAAAA